MGDYTNTFGLDIDAKHALMAAHPQIPALITSTAAGILVTRASTRDDLGRELGKVYTLKDEKIWMQDNQPLAPYGLGSAWVSNTFHHYCLQFRNE